MSKGLGDSIDKITSVIGIKKAVKTISKMTGKDCGCDDRREMLNKKYPWAKN